MTDKTGLGFTHGDSQQNNGSAFLPFIVPITESSVNREFREPTSLPPLEEIFLPKKDAKAKEATDTLKAAIEKTSEDPMRKLGPVMEEVINELMSGKLDVAKLQKMMADIQRLKRNPYEVLDAVNQELEKTLGITIDFGFRGDGSISHINISTGPIDNQVVVGIPREGPVLANKGTMKEGSSLVDFTPFAEPQAAVDLLVKAMKQKLESAKKKPLE